MLSRIIRGFTIPAGIAQANRSVFHKNALDCPPKSNVPRESHSLHYTTKLPRYSGYAAPFLRCQFKLVREEIVKTHGKKRVWAKEFAEFDCDHNPRYLIVDEFQPAGGTPAESGSAES
jgi:hypothetical protein